MNSSRRKIALGDIGDWAAMAAMHYGKCSGEIAWAISTQLRTDTDHRTLLLGRLQEAQREAEKGAADLGRAIISLESTK